MLLADDERLTLADLQRERLLAGVRCFNASGCVTGLVDLETAPDELGSFAAGVLQAGAASAIATQWSVSDYATYLLMLRFAQLVVADPNLRPAQALQQASRWLRTAGPREVTDLGKQADKAVRSIEDVFDPLQFERDVARGLSASDVAGGGARDSEAIETTARGGHNRPAATHVPRTHVRDHPFAHPIYWAAAVVYGA
jgi:CHAT domain-containing protein